MQQGSPCPHCQVERAQQPQLCEQGHRYVSLPLGEGHGTSPLWLAVQLLDDECARLRHLAEGADVEPGQAQGHLSRAAALEQAAELLQQQPQPAPVGAPAASPTAPGLPSHLEVTPQGSASVALRCGVCGQTCTVPDGLSTREVLEPFLRLHPGHGGGCPEWAAD